MTVDDAKKVTEVAKEKLKENGDVYSEHILAYISYLESQIGKMKCCGNCFNLILAQTKDVLIRWVQKFVTGGLSPSENGR